MFFSKLLFISSAAVLLISGLLWLAFSSRISPDNDVELEVIPIDAGAFGPESFAFDPLGGGPYTGVSDGRIIKWDANQRRWTDFAVTSPQRDGCVGGKEQEQEEKEHICGRPLGLRWDEKRRRLYIADAYFGVLMVEPNGGLATSLVSSNAHGMPFKFINALEIHQTTGAVYFTHSSNAYTRRNHMSIIASSDSSGSLMKYDPESKQVVTLLKNLSFPNGVALSQNGNFILVAETTNCRILRFWVETGTTETFADLPGFPDNINRNQNGEFWVALYIRRGRFLKWILSKPWIGKALTKLPIDITKVSWYITRLGGHGLAVKLGANGEILETLEDRDGKSWKYASEVMERDGYVWIGSVKNSFLVKKLYT